MTRDATPIEKATQRHAAVLESLKEPRTLKQIVTALRSESGLVKTSLKYLIKRGQVVALNKGWGRHPIFYKAVE